MLYFIVIIIIIIIIIIGKYILKKKMFLTGINRFRNDNNTLGKQEQKR